MDNHSATIEAIAITVGSRAHFQTHKTQLLTLPITAAMSLQHNLPTWQLIVVPFISVFSFNLSKNKPGIFKKITAYGIKFTLFVICV